MTISDKNVRRWLDREHDDKVAELAARLRAGETLESLAELRERVKVVDETRRKLAADWRVLLRVYATTITVVVALVSVLALWPLPSVRVDIDVVARAVSMKLAEDATIGPMELVGPVQVRGLSYVDAVAIELANPEAVRGASVSAEAISLAELNASSETWLDLAVRPTSAIVTAQLGASAIVAALEVGGNVDVVTDDDNPRTPRAQTSRWFPTPETIFLSSAESTNKTVRAPMEIVASGLSSPAELTGLFPSSLRFVERRSSGTLASPFGGSLVGGRVSILETNDKYSVAEADLLSLDELEVDELRLVVDSDIRLRLFGRAGHVRLRTGGVERSLKPSVLELLSKNHRVALLWGAAAFAWGMLWTARRAFGV